MIITSKAVGDGMTPQSAFRPAALDAIHTAGVQASFYRLPDGDFICVLPKTQKDEALLAELRLNKDVEILVDDYSADKDVPVKNPDKFKGEDTSGTTEEALLRLIRRAEPTIPSGYFDKQATDPNVGLPIVEIDGEVIGGR